MTEQTGEDQGEYEYYYEDEDGLKNQSYDEKNVIDSISPPPPIPKQKSWLRNMDIEDALPTPYKNTLVSKTKYHVISFLVTHPRIYALYLLFETTWPRGLVLVDMYTDYLVARALYDGQERIWFMLSSLFIVLPFVLVWSVSLRFLQSNIQKQFDKLLSSKHRPLIQFISSVFLMIYIFPLVGALLMATVEVFWVIGDIFRGIKAFIFGTGLIDTENRNIKSLKSYRRAVQVLAESVPQTILQLYIFIRLTFSSETDHNVGHTENTEDYFQGVGINALTISFGVSLLNLVYNVYKFKSEAQLHGMTWAEYALSVLQLAEVPIIKLVPRTPAIKKGYIEEVNLSGFRFDKESLTPLFEAINSARCRLKAIKLSIGSLSKLDTKSCQLLGNLLNNTGIDVIISRSSSLLNLKVLFESFDIDNTGYLEEEEFITATETLNCSIQNATKQQKRRIFKALAIRRLEERDRVYFYDFFKTATSVEDIDNNDGQILFDLTQIDFPLHYIFHRIQQIVEQNEIEKEDDRLISSLNNLYQFCEGLRILDAVDAVQNHVFYPIIDVLSVLTKKKSLYPKYTRFVSALFDKILNSNAFDGEFYLKRNVFDVHVEQKLKLLNVSKLGKHLQKTQYGVNIFEYCFMFQPEYRPNQCKIFTRLLNVWLNKTKDKGTIKTQITSTSGALYHLFNMTNGFHITDDDGRTPLFYAVKYGLNDVTECFATVVIPFQLEKGTDWVRDQSYLHTIIHHLLKTDAKNPAQTMFQLFLSTKCIDLNYLHEGKHLADYMLIYRRLVLHVQHQDYILACFEALSEYNYDFSGLLDLAENNILHYASNLNDIEAVDVILRKCQPLISTLLNATNKQNRNALSQAFEHNNCDIVKRLIVMEQQQSIDYDVFLRKLKKEKEIREKWIICLHELVRHNNGVILNKMSKLLKERIYILLTQLQVSFEQKHRKAKKKANQRTQLRVMHAVTVIQKKLQKHVDANSLPIERSTSQTSASNSSLLSKARQISVTSSVGRSPSIHADDTDNAYKAWYLNTIRDKRKNTCIGIKNISLREAAVTWISIDVVMSIVQLVLWFCIIWVDQIEIRYIDSDLFILLYLDYICLIGWTVIIVTDALALYGMSECVGWCVVIKMISLVLSVLLTVAPLGLIAYETDMMEVRMVMIGAIVFSILFALFSCRDMYRVYKWIKYYQNGGVYQNDDRKLEETQNIIYKIINMEKAPELNGQYCKVVLILDNEQYRVRLVNDTWSIGPRIVHKSNLEVVFEAVHDDMFRRDLGKYLFEKKTPNQHITEDHDDEDEEFTQLDTVEEAKKLSLRELNMALDKMKRKVMSMKTLVVDVNDDIIMGNSRNGASYNL
eukprot:25630_1